MKTRFTIHPWKVIENELDPKDLRFSESIMSLGNGAMGMRGNFEEDYSGDSHRGAYIGGVWFPDKTRVGWWKNGYPDYFGKVINAVNLMGLRVKVNDTYLDAAKLPVQYFHRELDMQNGLLQRQMRLQTNDGAVDIVAERFVSMAAKQLLAIRYTVTPYFDADIQIEQYLDGNIHNEDSNYDEKFWVHRRSFVKDDMALVLSKTKENPFGTPRFTVGAAACGLGNMTKAAQSSLEGFASVTYEAAAKAGDTVALDKLVAVATDRDMPEDQVEKHALRLLSLYMREGYDALKKQHVLAWEHKWETSDVQIEGDDEAQQGIRFNLFHLLSTYTGEDARLNIGPKGFTGEKYGGATYWDTEAFCFPVYMAISGEQVAKQLLLYRHRQLPQAFENARRLGLPGALYPMVTFTGIECHNEWEITFEEIHRNGAIAFAIFNYVAYAADFSYLKNEGLDVLTGIARFWAGRVHWQKSKNLYMIHGVTGPNEYENNVSNNWYTNRIAAWCLSFLCQAAGLCDRERLDKLNLTSEELELFRHIADNMYYPVDEETGIFVQQDTFLDKDLQPASELPREDRPLNHHWSWDRILRSCYLKQADVLQGLYTLGHLYDTDTKRLNFDFYEPMTVHESSLSPCVHAVLAAEIGYEAKAVEMYHRTARLDLDNVNHDTADGLHVTSMSGSWLAIAQGFAGMRTAEGLSFSPMLPANWASYAFRFIYRERVIRVKVTEDKVVFHLERGNHFGLKVYGQDEILEDKLTILRRSA
ncbi:MAG: glycoside hydrolase family 65 protein [Clostridiales bacterium]|nr:glycoside hydrolase family 65 protein [Clostridiales bacterium]